MVCLSDKYIAMRALKQTSNKTLIINSLTGGVRYSNILLLIINRCFSLNCCRKLLLLFVERIFYCSSNQIIFCQFISSNKSHTKSLII